MRTLSSTLLLLLLAAAGSPAEVKHGSELKRGVNCGLPEGTVLQEDSTAQFTKAEVITGKSFGAVTLSHNEGVVKFVRCKFTNPGYVAPGGTESPSPGTVPYTVNRAGTGSVELEDCEVFGGKMVAIRKVDKLTRTYVSGGNDLLRAPEGDSFYTEIMAEMLLKSSPESHSDVLQITFTKDPSGKPLVAQIHVVRCLFNATVPAGTKNANGAIQSGAFQEQNGVLGEITNCFFDGGAFSLSGGAAGELGKPIVLRGNQFGRNAKFGPFNPNWKKNHDLDDSNVWADTGKPAASKNQP